MKALSTKLNQAAEFIYETVEIFNPFAWIYKLYQSLNANGNDLDNKTLAKSNMLIGIAMIMIPLFLQATAAILVTLMSIGFIVIIKSSDKQDAITIDRLQAKLKALSEERPDSSAAFDPTVTIHPSFYEQPKTAPPATRAEKRVKFCNTTKITKLFAQLCNQMIIRKLKPGNVERSVKIEAAMRQYAECFKSSSIFSPTSPNLNPDMQPLVQSFLATKGQIDITIYHKDKLALNPSLKPEEEDTLGKRYDTFIQDLITKKVTLADYITLIKHKDIQPFIEAYCQNQIQQGSTLN